MRGESFRRGVRVWCRRAHFRSDAAQRYIRAQKTRSKCRRRFTALHHNTRTPRLRFCLLNLKLSVTVSVG